MLVRVFIDKPGGVSVGDCERVHVSLGHALDVQDPIQHPYTLEVSSPGLDRPLKTVEQFQRSQGKLLRIKLRQPWEGQWRITARLLEATAEGLLLAPTNLKPPGTVRFTWDAIAEAKIEVMFGGKSAAS
jgi:ribosome maturation factor RimP